MEYLLQLPFSLVFETEPLTNQEHIGWASLISGHRVPRILQSSLPICWDYMRTQAHLAFHMGAGYTHLGPQICTVNIF